MKRSLVGVIVVALLAGQVEARMCQEARPGSSLLDVLVWGTFLTTTGGAYPPAVEAQIDRLRQRADAYRTGRSEPSSAEMRMVYDARVRYERRLIAMTDEPEAQALAAAYVDALHPCYEWEGGADCPEREAVFATEYHAAHPNGPFREFLPLLAAHRWICAAEGYDFEMRPDQAGASRRAYEKAVLVASASADLLVRTAAADLMRRGRCHAGGS